MQAAAAGSTMAWGDRRAFCSWRLPVGLACSALLSASRWREGETRVPLPRASSMVAAASQPPLVGVPALLPTAMPAHSHRQLQRPGLLTGAGQGAWQEQRWQPAAAAFWQPRMGMQTHLRVSVLRAQVAQRSA